MKQILEKIVAQEVLSIGEARQFLLDIAREEVNEMQLSGILTAIQFRGIQLPELIGFREALLELKKPVNLDGSEAIDLCGTGGDGKNTFNISTCSSILLASMGYRVIKHGNYGVSSLTGSSNVLEALGLSFTTKDEDLQRSLDDFGICFLHAPLFHPALAKFANVRKSLAMPTLFNALGPLVNPVQPQYQLTGTFSLELAVMYQHVLRKHRSNFKVIYGMDGYDEIALTDQTRVLSAENDEMCDAASYGTKVSLPADLDGGANTAASAELLSVILQGKGNEAQQNVIAATTCEAIHCFEPQKDRKQLFEKTLEHLKSGKGYELLKKMSA